MNEKAIILFFERQLFIRFLFLHSLQKQRWSLPRRVQHRLPSIMIIRKWMEGGRKVRSRRGTRVKINIIQLAILRMTRIRVCTCGAIAITHRPKRKMTAEEFKALHEKKSWEEDHIHLDNMDVIKFCIDTNVQRLLHELQTIVVDQPYKEWGRTTESWEGYTLLLRNGFQSGDRRKPVTDEFQAWFETVYCPIFLALLYGEGWDSIHDHFSQFKACTIKVCQFGETFYGKNVFHMHVDMKIGVLEPRNYTQKHGSRLLFSIVPEAIEEGADAKAPEFGTTVYPLWQPRAGFRNNHEFHNYMMKTYSECGIENSGLPRPHYIIEENLVYRAITGEVLINKSHADHKQCQPIHAEPNPCPDRYLFCV